MASLLKTNLGMYFQVRRFSHRPDKPQLCVVDSQVGATKVDIKEDGGLMAFRFFYDGAYYTPKADSSSLKLDKVECDSASYWFEKENIGGGEHYALKTVGGTSPQYLAIAKKGKISYLELSKSPSTYISSSYF